MLQPGVYDIKLQRRADYSVLLQFKDNTGTAINLTGWAVAAQVWDAARSTKYADFLVTYIDASQGRVKLSLTSTQTSSFIRELQYDVLLTDPNGIKEYYLEGAVITAEGYTST